MEWTKDTWDTERWPSFTFSEMRCKETDTNRMDKEFMDMLQQLRHRIGQPLYIASGYRDASHSAEKSKKNAGSGPHPSGKAVDIKVYGKQAMVVVREALALGFTGVGLKQHGEAAHRFVHLDTMPSSKERPRPWLWSYS
jgi:uncharacterized protein YcbK (DUF882 family)